MGSTHEQQPFSHGGEERQRGSAAKPAEQDIEDKEIDEQELEIEKHELDGELLDEWQELERQRQEEQASERESLRRALRDLEAAEERVKRNAERVYDEARSSLVLELFPVLDNLDRSIEAARARGDPAILEGVRMVRKQLDEVLVRYGVERIDATGRRFDPSEHEAVAKVPAKDRARHMMVLEQVAPGYRFGNRLLRPAKVVVAVAGA
jgi:molecular chaperone GrpE